jgi:hypothetical protein
MSEDQSDMRDDGSDASTPQRPTLSYATGKGNALKLKTLRRLPPFEANLAANKLETHGVRCFVDDQNLSTIHPLLFGDVRLQVDEADLERAEQILATPGGVDIPESEREDLNDDYVEEAYRCPKCRRKSVDLLPVSPGMRNARFGCLFILVLPLLFTAAGALVGLETRGTVIAQYEGPLLLAWVAIVIVLSLVVLLAKRGKRCRECGHEWGPGASAKSSA